MECYWKALVEINNVTDVLTNWKTELFEFGLEFSSGGEAVPFWGGEEPASEGGEKPKVLGLVQ